MARKNVLISDLTGNEIASLAYVRLVVGNDEWQLDIDSSEDIVQMLQTAGKKRKRRGRKAKTAA